MRILTWNINGIRTIPQYHPWNTLKTHDDILNHLNADIICFQEMKSSRAGLPKSAAIPPSYDSFFSFPVKKTGYSGVAVYTRRSCVIPVKAEEGLTGMLQPKPPLTQEERISPARKYPIERPVDEQDQLFLAPEGDLDETTEVDGELEETPGPVEPLTLKTIDAEGRALVVSFGLFVLINVYCPNDGTGSPERDAYKMAFHRLLSARVKELIEEGHEVVVVGDLNACASVLDHCEGELVLKRAQREGLDAENLFWGGKSGRSWLRDWLIREHEENGTLVDVVRKFWPGRKGMYTCWNTKISARESNYGTRIDFILVTPGLVPWVKHADIQPEIKGSDHCPVYIDLHNEIIDAEGNTIRLGDVMGGLGREPPRLAAKFWDEYSGKQMLLGQFFGKKAASDGLEATAEQTPTSKFTQTATPCVRVPPVPQSSSSPANANPIPEGPSSIIAEPIPSTASASITDSKLIPIASSSDPHQERSLSQPKLEPSAKSAGDCSTTKRKLTADSNYAVTKKFKAGDSKAKGEEKKAGQTKLASYFGRQKSVSSLSTSTSKEGSVSKSNKKGKALKKVDEDELMLIEDDPPMNPIETQDVDIEADYQLALMLSQESTSSISSQTSGKGKTKDSGKAWSTLLTPIQAPKCIVHNEPAKELTVNKQGPNKGKRFFICSRPVGPGYDKGRSERLREEVDPQWKCDFFKWSSEIRREMMKGDGKDSNDGAG
ncbi:Endonuclease/exonuclease/phosphatase [Crucibulum laeve]|uniref:DNA-(apurinic or apyrimidinic site) endonuclease n=1 Tax=Crucibulum laeve TaxID=68775 RepID=A0A5C3M6Y3_9AGAR|nr:Endonuclease/exonuclease/phosphatase [Crucibulum laeve]